MQPNLLKGRKWSLESLHDLFNVKLLSFSQRVNYNSDLIISQLIYSNNFLTWLYLSICFICQFSLISVWIICQTNKQTKNPYLLFKVFNSSLFFMEKNVHDPYKTCLAIYEIKKSISLKLLQCYNSYPSSITAELFSGQALFVMFCLH